MAQALMKGATLDDLMNVTGWNRSTTQSAIIYDMHTCMGLGIRTEFGDDGKARYFVVVPAGVTSITREPVVAAPVKQAANRG